MSIIIKGLDMPRNCSSCPLWQAFEEGAHCGASHYFMDYDDGYEDHRPQYCPLVPIPPHGRLIDGDLLPWLLANTDVKFNFYEDWERLCDYIYAAPTIIEAEGEDGT